MVAYKESLQQFIENLKRQRADIAEQFRLAGTEVSEDWKQLLKDWENFHSRERLAQKIHLSEEEARAEFEILENEWADFKARANRLAAEAGKAAHEVGEALEMMGLQIRGFFHHIKRND